MGRASQTRQGEPGPLARDDVARLLQAMPPHAAEAEVALLGSLLIDPSRTGEVLQVIAGGEDFFRPVHRTIYSAIVELYERTAAVDIVQLAQLLRDRGVIDEIGGPQYLVDLAEGVPTASHAVEFARQVRDKATLRELIDAAGEILGEAHRRADDAPAVLEAAEQRVFSIAQRREVGGAVDMRVVIDESLRQISDNAGARHTGLPTGFTDLDEYTSGLQGGEMVVVAARPSMGKTALALNMLEQVASHGHPVALFSLEMGRQALVQRLLCARAGVDSHKLRRGMLQDSDYGRLRAAGEELSNLRIYIDDTPALSALALRSRARRLRERYGIRAVFIDYMQLLTAGTRVENRQTEVSDISRSLKALAREITAPVVCLSQLNRATEDRKGNRPRLSDLRESGAIEQDADVVMLLHREEYYHQGDDEWLDANPDKRGTAELIIAKQRNGPTGIVNLIWDSSTTSFKDQAITAPKAVAYVAPGAAWRETGADDLPV